MHLSAVGSLVLVFLPLSAALHARPQDDGPVARDLRRDDVFQYRRAVTLPGEEPTTTHTTTEAATSSQPTTSTTPPPTSTTSTTTSTTTSSTPPPTSSPPTTSTAPPSTRAISTNQDGSVIVSYITAVAPSSASASSTAAAADTEPSGPGKGTYIGLGVAGGVALLALAGFIIWKFTQKRFSSFDDEEGADINWPMPKEELAAPKAPAMSSAAANATSSSVDLTASDPYAVPPLPARSTYYDDPSGTAAAAYYDPYRGPVPHTFHSPPGSVDSHAQQYAEAIPMSTYPSGRQSPGPNAAYDLQQQQQYQQDPYGRTRSPGPNMAYEQDPYAAGRRSPGPSLAYGMDPARTGTPVSMMGGPPRMGTPLGAGGPGGMYPPPNIPPGLDVPRAGTPQSYGRASPAIPAAYAAQQPLVNPYGRSTPNPYGP